MEHKVKRLALTTSLKNAYKNIILLSILHIYTNVVGYSSRAVSEKGYEVSAQ